MPSVKRLTLEQRFWAKVDRRGPSECWPWTAAVNEHGYGVMRPDTDQRTGPTIKAHRVSAQLVGMDIEGMKVLHSCDNPPCVNPAHLRPGTMLDNSTDMVVRDRNQFGEACAWSKLTEASVREIKRRLRAGEMQKTLAAEFNVSKGTIQSIAAGKSWRRVTDGTGDLRPMVGSRGGKRPRTDLSNAGEVAA